MYTCASEVSKKHSDIHRVCSGWIHSDKKVMVNDSDRSKIYRNTVRSCRLAI